jgi:hypothetical protein
VEKMKGMTLSAEPGKKMGPFTEFTLTAHDPALNWEDLTWLKEVAGDVPIYMKGVSSIEVSHLPSKQLASSTKSKRQTALAGMIEYVGGFGRRVPNFGSIELYRGSRM